MAIGGIILLVVAIVAVLWYRNATERLRAMTMTETIPCADLAALRDAAAQAVGPGVFRQPCEVVGTAEAGDYGVLTAELSKAECVWHRHIVRRRYEEVSTDSEGRRQSSTKTETVAEMSSSTLFYLRDTSGSVLIDPAETDIADAEQVVNRFERVVAAESARSTISVFGLTLSAKRGDQTLGYEYEEWIVRPGQRLYVLGEAADHTGQLVVGTPEKGRFTLSTRSEEALIGSARRERTIAAALAVIGGAAGVILLLLSQFR